MKKAEKIPINEKVISDTFRKSANVMIAGSMTAFIGTTIDSIITSRILGVTYVSSFQLVQPLMLVVTMLAMLIFNGLQNVYANKIGAGKMHEAHTVMSLSILILGVISAVCALAYCLLAHPIVSKLGASDVSSLLHTEAVAYIYGIAPGLIGICLQQLLSYIVMMEGRQNVVLTAIIVQTVVNITGDILAAKVFQNGLLGMGLASTVCYYSAIAVLLISMIRRPVSYRFTLKGVQWKSLLEVFRMGMPGAAERLYLVAQTLFMNSVLLAKVSAEAVAAYAILSTLNNLLQSVAAGTAGTMFTMASVYAGEKDGNSLKATLSSSMRYVVTVESIVLVAVLLTAPLLILPFIGTDGAEVQQTAVFALRALSLSVILYGVNHTYQRYIQAVGAMKMAYLIPALDSVIGFIPSALLLLTAAGERGIWFAYFAGEILAVVFVMLITSVKQKKAALHLESYLYFPEDILIEDTDVMDVSVNDMESLPNLSEQCQQYCLERDSSSKKAMLIALSVEEMGKNIFRYNESKITVDVRLLKKEETWVLRIRDNGQAFDPTEWMRIHQAEEKEKNIGIRMIAGLCSRFDYISIMSMNNLIIYI